MDLSYFVDTSGMHEGIWRIGCLGEDGECTLSEERIEVRAAVDAAGETVAAATPGFQTFFFWWPGADAVGAARGIDFLVYELVLPGGVRAFVYEGWYPAGGLSLDAAAETTSGGLEVVERSRTPTARGEKIDALVRSADGGGDGICLDVMLTVPEADASAAAILDGVRLWRDVRDFR